uniref:C2H2-type domain-containing protein n=1 Tax=Leptobrachium leishanense TaxID=445787 RepID=A0A8C5N3G5_9ANUR
MNPLTARDPLSQRILDLTLEMIFLLTGEGHMVVKIHDSDSSRHQISEGHGRSQSFNTEPPPHSGIHEQNHEKILELSNQIIRLLTGEVPIRCEDVTVYLSMEEWEYVERHKELYEDVMMEDHQPVITRDKSVWGEFHAADSLWDIGCENGSEILSNNVEKDLNKTRKGRAESATYTERESLASEERHVAEKEIYPITEPPEYSPPDIKEEPASCDEGNLTDTDMYEPPEHTQTQYTSTYTGAESESHGEGDISHPDISPLPEHTQTEYPSTDIKEEPASCGEHRGNISNPEVYPFPEHLKTESVVIKEEPTSCDKRKLTDTNIYKPPEHTQTDLDGGEYISDPDICPLPEHTQTKYPSVVIKKESHTWEEGNLTNMYKTEEPTECSADNGEYLKSNPNPVEINHSESLIESRKPDHSIYYTDLLTQNSVYEGHSAPSSEMGKVSYSDPDLVIQETNCREQPFSTMFSGENSTIKLAITHQQNYADEQPFSVPECGNHFTDISAFAEHQRMHTGKKGFRCTECGKYFTQCSHLVTHTMIHTGVKPFKCDECGKCFITSAHLVQHKRIHTGEKICNCDECGKCFTRFANLARHKRIHTGEKLFDCTECGKCFIQASQLAVHKRIHTGEKPYNCNECGKCFTVAASLAFHKRIHTGEKSFLCNECGKCFTQSSHLAVHKRIHTGEKPYNCNECGKRFTQSSQLAVHKMTHTGEKPFKCTECGKCFIWASNFARHKRVHTGEKPFKCTECEKSFSQSSKLTAHKRIHT